jgi:hypothetical protein
MVVCKTVANEYRKARVKEALIVTTGMESSITRILIQPMAGSAVPGLKTVNIKLI